jgi:glycosyltransferase involved in cell wall biosynthesis
MRKILFYSHTIDFAGTWRSHERILLNLDKEKFDVYVFYNPNLLNDRLEYIKDQLGEDKVIPFNASIDKESPSTGYKYRETNFSELAKSMNFDIIHFARGGYYEWPFIERIAPLQIETNIFGFKDNSNFLDCSVTICNRINDIRGGSDYVVYNAIPQPIESNDNLKEELNIPNDYHIFGRIGRKANFNPIAIESLSLIKNMGYKFKYIIIGACSQTINLISSLGLSDDCIIIETTNDDEFIHKFNNTIDVFLHYRSDGECHSTAIAQALIYGVPVISHYGGYNGQSETIKDGGYVANNINDYTEYLLKLLNDKEFYNKISNNAKERAMEFEQFKIVKQWEEVYLKNIV